MAARGKASDNQPTPHKSTSATDAPRSEERDLFPVVAIGASAGGVRALQTLFRNLSSDTDMAYVVILHLVRDHSSNLAQLLGQCTDMPVENAADGMALEPNQVYVIPPNKALALADGNLQVTTREHAPGKFKPIDQFFESLAEQRQDKTVGVVLSGTGSDGALGIQAIKAAGGITFAQSEDSAEFSEMPHNAVKTGQVDLVRDVEGISRELDSLKRHPHLKKPADHFPETSSAALQKIHQQLNNLGSDFSSYKQSTVFRRISRRMAINKIEDMEQYADYLGQHPQEVKALREDLLIKVTQFFRNPETYAALEEKVFPQLLKDKQADDTIRVWVAGCASGEEVYSLAIKLLELLEDRQSPPALHIFGSDISPSAIEKARAGYYARAQVEALSESQRKQFFVPSDDGYKVKKKVREICTFALQDFTRDPPFSRLDLITCRNVLIYFDADLQKKVLSLFHFALNPDGFLMLGKAETIGRYEHLFSTVDKKNRIYAKKKTARANHPGEWSNRQTSSPRQQKAATTVADRRKSGEIDLQHKIDRVLLHKLEPVAVVVDSNLTIVHFRGETGPFLEHPPGKASLDLLKMVKDSLRLDLHNLIQRAKKEQLPQQAEHGVSLEEQGESVVSLDVTPFDFEQETFFLIQFRQQPVPTRTEAGKAGAAPAAGGKTSTAPRREIERLKQELASTHEYIESVVEEKDEALEDLKAANEEILSSNEELQSINEEIETAKEELESSNEELSTVNQELQTRNEELYQAHNDLHNLILSAQIPFLIVNDDLKIRRVSPNADKSLNISVKDVGRPLGDCKLSFELPDLEKTLLKVIHDDQEVEYEIQDQAGVWNLLRIRPYRIEQTGAVEGAVLTLFEVDRIKRSMEEIEKAHKYALRIVDSVKDPLLVLDENLVCRTANPAFYQKFQVSPYETEGRRLFELGAGQWDQPELRRLLEDILPHSTRMDDYQVEFNFPNLGPRIMMLSARRMEAASVHRQTILLGVEDVTDQKLVEKYLRQAKQDAEKASLAKSEFLATISHEVRSPLTVIVSALQFLKQTELDQQQGKCLELAETSSNLLLELLEDLLDFSKIEAGKIDLSLKPMDVRQLVDNVAERYRPKALGRGLEFILQIDQAVPPTLLGDSKYLKQILDNLVGNAVKFTQQGRINLEVKLTDKEPPGGGSHCLLFAVRDTGVGIPSDQIELMFERFTQMDSSSTREYGGTGLGLAICKRLVDYMGGTIWAESQPGEGSAFFFTIPLREAERPVPAATAPPMDQAAASPNLPGQTGPARILVAEDDLSIRHMLGVVLKNWGWQMVVAENGAQVLEKFRLEKPSLVLMDLQMPDMDGLQATRALREQYQIPIIGLTAHAGPEHREAGLAAGMNAVIIKPFSMNELKTTLETYLRAETDN